MNLHPKSESEELSEHPGCDGSSEAEPEMADAAMLASRPLDPSPCALPLVEPDPPPSPEEAYEARVAAFKQDLRPKIEALDFSGLIRGNLAARGRDNAPL